MCANFEVNDDFVNIYVGEETIINVLSNDGYDVGTLQMIIESQPTHGTVTLNQNNTITYIHDGSENLSDSFEYYLSNGLCSGVATVYINVISGCAFLNSVYYLDSQTTPISGGISYFNINTQTSENIEIQHLQTITPNIPVSTNFILLLTGDSIKTITAQEIDNAINNNEGILDITEGTFYYSLFFSNCD